MLKLYRNVVMVGLVGLGLAACGDKVTVTQPVTPVPGVTSVSIAPANLTIAINQQVAYAASVIADAGVATTVTWTSGNTAIATVDAAGLVKGIAAGTTTITATSTADVGKKGIASVTVSAVPPSIVSFTITPTVATLAPGGFVQISPVFVMAPGVASPTPTYSIPAADAAIATVNSAGKVTALAAGTTVVTATAVSGTSTMTATLGVTVRALVPATISISSVTTGILTLPVTLSNVAGQIEFNLNFNPGEQTIDSLTIEIRGVRAAKASYATVPAAGIITLSVNTAEFTKNLALGRATVSYLNGPADFQAKMYVHGSNVPTATQVTPIQLNNNDGWAADITKPTHSVVGGDSWGTNNGLTYWGGPTAPATATIYPVIYTPNRSISSVEWTIGAVGNGNCDWAEQTTMPFTATFGGTAGTIACNYENDSVIRDNIIIDMALDNALNTYPTVGAGSPLISDNAVLAACLPIAAGCVTGSTPDSLRLDYVAPENDGNPDVSGAHGFYWVNAAWTFPGAFAGDYGVGMDAAPVYTLYRAAGVPITNGGSTSFPTETNTNSSTDGYRIFYTVADRLGNLYTSGNSSYFGVDRTNPTIRYPTTTTLTNLRTYAAAKDTVAPVAAAPAAGSLQTLWAAEAIDNRSGLFDFNTDAVTGGVTQSVTRLAPGFLGTSVSLTSDNNYGATLIDGYRQTVAIPVWGSSGLTNTSVGYYTYTASISDRAGNTVTLANDAQGLAQRRYAIDPGTPLATGLTMPFTFGANALSLAGTFQFSASDNLEIITAQLGISFPNAVTGSGPEKPIVFPSLAVGIRWDGTLAGAVAVLSNLTTPVVATVATPDFWGGMQLLCNTGCVDADGGLGEPIVAGATYQPDSVSAYAVNLFGAVSLPTASAILPGSLPATTELPANTYTGNNINTGIQVHYLTGTTKIRQVSGYSVTLPQLARLQLFKLSAANQWVWQATVSTGTGSDNGLERFWDYDFGAALTTGGSTWAVVSVYNGPVTAAAGTALWFQFVKP